MNVKIEVDYREKPSGILEVLRNRSEIKRLSIGDYLINGHYRGEKDYK